MSLLSGLELGQLAARQLDEVTRALNHTKGLRAAHDRDRAEIASRYARAHEELLAQLLPSMAPEHLVRAAAMTGYASLNHPGVLGAMEAERRATLARLAQIAADPRFAHAELLRAPRTGSLTRQIAELEHYLAPLQAVLDRAAHARLHHLLEVGYGTEAYDVPFWRVSYYADWKAGDEILALFPGKAGFGELRDELLRTREAVGVYHHQLGELRREFEVGRALEGEHRTLSSQLSTLPGRHLQRAREALGRYLADADLPSIARRLEALPDVLMMFKRWSGLAYKLLYLDRLAQTQLDPLMQRLEQARVKLERDRWKWSKPKKAYQRFPAAHAAAYESRAAKYHKAWDRFGRTQQTIVRFDRYDAVDLSRDLLWWDVMTDGRIDGDFIPEVRGFRESHPGYRYGGREGGRGDEDAFDAAQEAAAAAAAADLASQREDLSFDPS